MSGPQRWHGLDLVRAVAMLLGVAFHAVFAYWPGVGRWYVVEDASTSAALASLGAALHAFRMEVFFTLAGFFAHLLVERRGADGFLAERARRLVVPFSVALPVSILSDLALRRWAKSAGLMAASYGAQDALRVAPMHLWFLEYLFLFCVVVWGVAKVVRPPWREVRLRWPEVLLVCALPTALGRVVEPELRPDATFFPLLMGVLHYGLFFGVGVWLYAARASLGGLARCWPMLPVGVLLAAYVFTRPLQWEVSGLALSGLVAWLVTLGALGAAVRFKPGDSACLRLLVDASYWVYLVHYPVVVALHLGLAPAPWPAEVKFVLVVAGTLAVTLGTFVAFIRRSWVGPWLGVRR